MAKTKGTFNAGWWNCFGSFASELLDANPYAYDICRSVLNGAGISAREAEAWLSKEEYHDPRVESVVRQYLTKL